MITTTQPTSEVENPRLSSFLLANLRDPVDGSELDTVQADPNVLRFRRGTTYPLLGRSPILISEASGLFEVEQIRCQAPTTQDARYRDRGRLKNYIRQSVLPSLTRASESRRLFERMSRDIVSGAVLVLGAGDKVEYYRRLFPGAEVITTDVHLQFGADAAVDGHAIPFADECFDLVLADQVLEHTLRPWIVAKEMQRVTRIGGLVFAGVPFCFIHHGQPYDFFRFTPGGLRSLFGECGLVELSVTNGPGSSAATFNAQLLLDLFQGKWRWPALVLGRYFFFWLKYLDAVVPRVNRSTAARGIAFLGRKDGEARTDAAILNDVRSFLNCQYALEPSK